MKKALLMIAVNSRDDVSMEEYQRFLTRWFWGSGLFSESTVSFEAYDAERYADPSGKTSSDIHDEMEELGSKAQDVIAKMFQATQEEKTAVDEEDELSALTAAEILDMGFSQLRDIAGQMGVKHKGMSKNQLVQVLLEMLEE